MSAEAAVFSALGDPHRLALVERLSSEGPISIAALTVGTGLTRQAVTKHLKVLEKSGLLRCRRIGRVTAWQIDRRTLAGARINLAKIAEQWIARLDRLKTQVET